MAFYGGSGYWPVGLPAEIWADATMIRGWKWQPVTRAGERFMARNKAPSVEDAYQVIVGRPQMTN